MSRWLHPLRDDARVRLFCFPSAGGGSVMFTPWRARLAPDVELCPVLLPGREARLRESAFTEMRALVAAATDALAGALDRPYALLGCSFGSLVAFEVARELRRRGLPAPQRLFALSRSAPHFRESVPVAQLPDDAFVAAIQARYAALPQALLAEPELLALFLPILRADFTVLEGYRHVPEPPLAVPIAAWFGSADRTLTRDRAAAWAEHTSAAFELHEVAAGHLFQGDTLLVRRIDELLR